MIAYRPFRNSDPPALVRIWRSATPIHGMARGITVEMLDSLVLAKPYFDPEGLLIATDDGTPVGFAHAGFGPRENLCALDQRRGVISMLMLVPEQRYGQAARELLAQAERYLVERGAEEIFAIGVGEVCPFYLGMYGGSDLAGVLDSDSQRQAFFREQGYEEIERVRVYQRELARFRPKVDRRQLQIGRTCTVELFDEPAPRSWWDAATHSCFEMTGAELRPRAGGPAMATATFWNMDTLSDQNHTHTVGLARMEIVTNDDSEGLAVFLLGESLRKLNKVGFTTSEGQAMQDDADAQRVFESLGFAQIDSGAVLRK